VLGAVLASQVTSLTVSGLADAGVETGGADASGVGIGQLNELPPALAVIVRAAYGDGTARIFLISAVLAVISLVTILFIREVPLRTMSGEEMRMDAEQAARAIGGGGAGPVDSPALDGRDESRPETAAEPVPGTGRHGA